MNDNDNADTRAASWIFVPVALVLAIAAFWLFSRLGHPDDPDLESTAPQSQQLDHYGQTSPASIGKPHECAADYPPDSMRLGEAGTTTLSFTITAAGTVSDPVVAKSSGFQRLDDASIQCAAGWLYRPATRDGAPVATPWKAQIQWIMR